MNIDLDKMQWTPERGLFLPREKNRYRAGPNPDREPPLDPMWQHELDIIGNRVSKKYRWYWMKENRIWSIQVYRGGDNWQTVHCVYDENGQWHGNQTPFKMVDRRDLEEFCQTDLGIKYGDIGLEAMKKRNDALDAASEKAKEIADKRKSEIIHAAMTGGDATRMMRARQAEPGLKFTEFHQVSRKAPLTPKGKKKRAK